MEGDCLNGIWLQALMAVSALCNWDEAMKWKTDLIKNNLLIRFNLKKFDGTWCPEASARVSDTSTCVTLISCVMWEVLLINYSSCVDKRIAQEPSWALTTNNRMNVGRLAFEWNPASYGTSTLFSDVFFCYKEKKHVAANDFIFPHMLLSHT